MRASFPRPLFPIFLQSTNEVYGKAMAVLPRPVTFSSGKIMPSKTRVFSGYYSDQGIIHLENQQTAIVSPANDSGLPDIPYGTKLEVTLTYEDVDYLNGTAGVVWATYHLRQAETIQAALLALSIACEVRESDLLGARLFAIHIPNASEVEAAMDFVWREASGLRLQPDWNYPAGAENASFEKWMNGI